MFSCRQELCRILVYTIEHDFIVHVGTSAASGCSQITNLLPIRHHFTGLDKNLIEVGIAAANPVAVIDLDKKAKRPLPAGISDPAGRGRIAEFCALYDQCSFDPDYDTLPIAYFEPMLRRIFAAPKWTEHGA